MYKVAPPSRVIGRGAGLKVIYIGKGYPDYMGLIPGYEPTEGVNQFRAVEVKEAKPCEGDSVPASRLTATQREFMTALPEGTAYVFILWRNGDYEMFSYINKGSYKKSTGIK